VIVAKTMSLLLTPQEVFENPDVLARLAAVAEQPPRPRDPTKPRLTTRCHFDRSVKSDNMYVTDGWTSPTGTRSLSPWANRSLSFMKSGLTP